MSSIATAPSRTAEEELRNSHLHYLADPEEQPTAAPALESHLGKTVPLDDVARVERLLTQLEARSMALVPYNYGNLREVPAPKSNRALVAGSLVAIWLSTLVFAVAYMRFGNQPPHLAEQAPVATPLVIPTAPDPQEQKVASSVDHLAKALVSSSERLNELEVAMERSNRDLQRMATKVATEKPKPPAVILRADAGEGAAPSEIPDGRLPKNWHKVIDVKPTETAVAHKGADGNIDYWLVPRGADKPQAKVLAIGTSVEGVVVHNLDDGKDYTLTPAGEWRNGSIAPSGN